MDVVNIITNVGFPIACCIALAYYITREQKTSREQIDSIIEKHEHEVDTLKEALDNNTKVLERLADMWEEK